MDAKVKEEKVIERLRGLDSAIIAFSGGVDSSYLAFLAQRHMDHPPILATAVSPSTSSLQKRLVREFLEEYGGEHVLLETREMDDERYRENSPERCYFCKRVILGQIGQLREETRSAYLLDGSNADDRDDYRPGAKAVNEFGIISPLAEAGMTKQDIRDRSRAHGLKTWDLPSMPCLASRIPYGIPITERAFRMIEDSEEFIRELGFKTFRVRHHDDLARIEVAIEEMERMLAPGVMGKIDSGLKAIGYKYAALNMVPFKSGSLNEFVDIPSGQLKD